MTGGKVVVINVLELQQGFLVGSISSVILMNGLSALLTMSVHKLQHIEFKNKKHRRRQCEKTHRPSQYIRFFLRSRDRKRT